MGEALVERSTGDVIPAADHNDVKDYIEDGTTRVNTLSLSIQGVGEVISSAGKVTPIHVVSPGAGGILFYASNGTTLIARMDEDGGFAILGSQYSL